MYHRDPDNCTYCGLRRKTEEIPNITNMINQLYSAWLYIYNMYVRTRNHIRKQDILDTVYTYVPAKHIQDIVSNYKNEFIQQLDSRCYQQDTKTYIIHCVMLRALFVKKADVDIDIYVISTAQMLLPHIKII